MWFDALDSMYHTLFGFELFTAILLSLLRSVIFDAYLRHLGSIRLCPKQSISSNTHSLYGPSGQSTSSLSRPFLVDFRHRLASSCSRKVRNFWRHDGYASSSVSIGCLHCVPTRLVHHDHGVYPLCVQHLVLGMCARRRTRVVLLYKEPRL